MAMPQVHIVAYCGDLGYGPARGAEMLSLMLGLGLIARVASGSIADKIGGLSALMIGSALQAFALLLYLGFNGLTSLYIVSGLFGLFQGGIIPMYAVIVREYFPPKDAGVRTGVALMFALFGMALGGWMSGAIFDLTGSYRAAFLNGFLWNLLNLAIIGWLLLRSRAGMTRKTGDGVAALSVVIAGLVPAIPIICVLTHAHSTCAPGLSPAMTERTQLPFSSCTSGMNMSFQSDGCFFIVPTLFMNST